MRRKKKKEEACASMALSALLFARGDGTELRETRSAAKNISYEGIRNGRIKRRNR